MTKQNDFNALTIDQVHLKFDLSSQNVIQVAELYIVTNRASRLWLFPVMGRQFHSCKFVGASSVQYQLAQVSGAINECHRRFCSAPGADKQYGFLR